MRMKEKLTETIFAIILELIDCEEFDKLDWGVKNQIEINIFENVEKFINKLF